MGLADDVDRLFEAGIAAGIEAVLGKLADQEETVSAGKGQEGDAIKEKVAEESACPESSRNS